MDRELGAGGLATVYLAHDLKHDRAVAIKGLHPDLGATLGGERFLLEARTTALLQHPLILSLLDRGEADGLLYSVMNRFGVGPPVERDISQWVYRDICQEVCLWNVRFSQELNEPAFAARDVIGARTRECLRASSSP